MERSCPAACCCCWAASVVSGSVRPQRRQPTRLHRPWDSPGKNTGVGCHFLLQCMKEKSESEVAQSCPTLSDPMDCSPPGSSVHGTLQARALEWAAIALSRAVLAYSKTASLRSNLFFFPLKKKFGVYLLHNVVLISAVEKREPSCNVGVNVKWYSRYGEQCGGSFKS